jgi:hypothetical protein
MRAFFLGARPTDRVRSRSTMADLMGVVTLVGLAFFLTARPIKLPGVPPLNLIPLKASVPEQLTRFAWFGGIPLLAIACQHRTGRWEIIAGLIAGIVSHGVYVVFLDLRSPRSDPFSLGNIGDTVVFSTMGAFNGLILGVSASGMDTLARAAKQVQAARRRA